MPGEFSTPDGMVYVAVMDPLAEENACKCINGFAQRDYKELSSYLAFRISCSVKVVFCNDIADAKIKIDRMPDFIIGKRSVIEFDDSKNDYNLTNIAMLTGKEGLTTLTGLVVVRKDDPAKKVSDLKGKKILFGPADCDEKYYAAIKLVQKAGVKIKKPQISPDCFAAAKEVASGKADAAVISNYALPLMYGCQTLEKGALRIIAETKPVPFVGVYAAEHIDFPALTTVQEALFDMVEEKKMLKVLESKKGFVEPTKALVKTPLGIETASTTKKPKGKRVTNTGWVDFGGGTARNFYSKSVPKKLPGSVKFLWKKKLQGQSLGGVSATEKYVIVSDKTDGGKVDTWFCFDAKDGHKVWDVSYPAQAEMDYTSAPRATAVIYDDKVYLLGALGHLNCVNLTDGTPVWKCNILEKFKGELPTWGYCATPLIVDDKIIVMPNSPSAFLAALDVDSGDVIWKTPGRLQGYGNLIAATFSGKRQIIGYDSETLGGWDIATGKRLWELRPEEGNDFNVPVPVKIGERLLAATENNGTRLYRFNPDGTINKKITAINEDAVPDTASPVVSGETVWIASPAGMFCLDIKNDLKTVWHNDDEGFCDHANFIAGDGVVLILIKNGKIAIAPARPKPGYKLKTLTVIKSKDDFETELWSSPAMIGDRLYIRSENEIACLLLR